MVGLEESGRELLGAGLWIAAASFMAAAVGAVFWLLGARIVGARDMGYVVTIFSVAGFLSLLSGLGLQIAVLRELPLRGGEVIVSAIVLGGVTGIVAGLLGSKEVTRLYGGGLEEYGWIVAMLTLLMVEGEIFRHALLACRVERLYFLVAAFSQGVRLFLGLGLALFWGARGLLAGLILGSLAHITGSMLIVFGSVELSFPGIDVVRRVLELGLSNYPLIISTGLIYNASVLLAALSTGSPSDTGVFYIALMVSVAIGLLPISIAYVSLPRMIARRDSSILAAPARVAIGLITPLTAVVTVSSPLILNLILGGTGGSAVLGVLAFSIIPASTLQLTISRLNAEGRLKNLVFSGVARLALLMVLTPLMVGFQDIVGIGLAYTISTIAGLLASGEWDMLKLAFTGIFIQSVASGLGLVLQATLSLWILTLLVTVMVCQALNHLLGLLNTKELLRLFGHMVRIVE